MTHDPNQPQFPHQPHQPHQNQPQQGWGQPPQPQQPQNYGQPPQQLSYGQGGYGDLNKPKGMAVAALVLGIISLAFCIIPYVNWCVTPICGLLAVIFGGIAQGRAKRGEGGGGGMAVGGLVCGLIALTMFLLVIVVFGVLLGIGAAQGAAGA